MEGQRVGSLLHVPGHVLLQIGSSGGLFGTPQASDQLLVAPGARIEVLLQASADPGTTTTLTALSYNRGMVAASTELDLMSIAYTQDAPMTAPVIPDVLRDIAPIDTTGAVERTFTLSEDMMSFLINGRSYDSARVDVHASLGATEVWTVRNTADMDHPFHLHGFQFQVIDRDGTPDPVVAWNDTVNVPQHGTVRFAVTLGDFPGMRMYHCHILEHEDLGMMGTIDIE